jgi:3',5'-cyclic AMP phosphodiesterase CpdA
MRLIQLSDLHFGTERPEVIEALTATICNLQPDLVLLSGDITQRARRGQFRRCESFLAQLPAAPVLAVPGNHDIPLFNLWQRFWAPYAHFRSSFGPNLAPEYTDADLLVIGVNTTRPDRHVDGCFQPEMVAHVEQRLRRSSASLKIVMGHHPVDRVLESDERNVAEGAEAAVRQWSDAGMVLYLGGHIHYPFCAPLERRYPGVHSECWTAQAGTAISRRVRDGKPNSFNLIEWQSLRRQLQLERWDYRSSSSNGFGCAEAFQLPLRGESSSV